MTSIKTRVHITADGTLTGTVAGLPAGEHDAEIMLLENGVSPHALDAAVLLARVRALQAQIARLPVLDDRNPDEIIGYDEHGHLD